MLNFIRQFGLIGEIHSVKMLKTEKWKNRDHSEQLPFQPGY